MKVREIKKKFYLFFYFFVAKLVAVSYFTTKYATSLIDDTGKVERLIF